MNRFPDRTALPATLRQFALAAAFALPSLAVAQTPAKPAAPAAPAPASPAGPAVKDTAAYESELPSGDEEGRKGKSDTSALQKALTKLNLSRDQRQEIHKVIDTADDERIRISRRASAAADDVKKLVREKIGAVLTDERKAKVGRIIDEELDRAKEARKELRDERHGRKGKAPGQARAALKSFQHLKDRVFKEIKMSDAEAEKMLTAFAEIRQAGHTAAEKIHDEFVKLRDDTKAKVLAVLTAEQRTKFEQDIDGIKNGPKPGTPPVPAPGVPAAPPAPAK